MPAISIVARHARARVSRLVALVLWIGSAPVTMGCAPDATSPDTTAPDGGEPGAVSGGPVHVVFVIHFDPLNPQGGAVPKAAYEQQRDNLVWLADFFEQIKAQKGATSVPKLTLEIAGDHAEYYAEDPVGLALLQRLHADGHELAIHFHNNYKIGPHEWPNATSPTPDTRVRVTTDHLTEVDALVAKVIGSSDAAAIRRANHVMQGHYQDFPLALARGFDVITTGQTEVFNAYFDHDPYTPWRSVVQGAQLTADPLSAWILVPGAPVLGTIGKHIVWVDVSVPAMQRKFMHVYHEARREGTGTDARIWVLGWHEHLGNIAGDDGKGGDIRSLRDEVRTMVTWLNDNFINKPTLEGGVVAKYATAGQVAAVFRDWEKANPGKSSFHYSAQAQDWNLYPYALEGLSRELANSHYDSELSSFRGQGVNAHKLLKTEGQTWAYVNGNITSTTPIWPIYLLWTDQSAATIDFSSVGARLRCIDGLSGAQQLLVASALIVTQTPMTCTNAP